MLGYSWGGALAQELAHRAPERVRRLVLCATAPGLGSFPPKPSPACSSPRPPATTTRRCCAGRSPGSPAGAPGGTRQRSREQADARLAHAPSPLGYAYQLYATMGWSSLPWLHRLTPPRWSSRVTTTP